MLPILCPAICLEIIVVPGPVSNISSWALLFVVSCRLKPKTSIEPVTIICPRVPTSGLMLFVNVGTRMDIQSSVELEFQAGKNLFIKNNRPVTLNLVYFHMPPFLKETRRLMIDFLNFQDEEVH